MSTYAATGPSILHGNGSESQRLVGLWWLLAGLATVVVALVIGLIVLALARREGPSRVGDDHWILAGGIALPVIVLSVLAVATVQATADLRVRHPGELRVEVVGRRWWWDIRYPGTGVVTANEIHVPVGRPLDIGLDSDNVTHSFWLPDLAGKVDLIPGQHNELRFTVRTPGVYRGLCAEYCGLEHAKMHFRLVAEPAEQFASWLAAQRADAVDHPGRAGFEASACAGCHTVRGTQANGSTGPDLTHLASRSTLAGDTLDNDAADLRRWIAHPQSLKPGALMPDVPLSPAALDALVAYLRHLR
jgi:cytochrome c oxidase subunit 2